MKRVALGWSGGKDSMMAFHIATNKMDMHIDSLVTTYNESNGRVSMHGVRLELVERQAESLETTLLKVPIPPNCSNEVYAERMAASLKALEADGITEIVFGDIFLEDVRRFREENLAQVGFKGVFPIWGRNTRELAEEFLKLGYRAVICCVDINQAPPELIGREYGRELLDKLPPSVDPCGEKGEFHTFVYDGPAFSKPINFSRGVTVLREERFLFMDLLAT